MGVGKIGNPKALEGPLRTSGHYRPGAGGDLARKSISNFKLREGGIGAKVTYEGHHVAFTRKVFNVVLPRIRDFRGLSPAHSMAVELFVRPEGADHLP